MQSAFKHRLVNAASAPYAGATRFDHGWARGKLSMDPVFAHLLDARLLPDGAQVMDLGCGRGLLAAWCLAAERLAGELPPAQGAVIPRGLRFGGIELMAREAACGNRVLQPVYGASRVQLTGGDMRACALSGAEVVTALDVLHYIPHADQQALLSRVHDALPRGGRLIARVGDADGGLRFRFGQWVDRCMSYAQGHRLPTMWCRPLREWNALLDQLGFQVDVAPMHRGTPFANMLLVAGVK